MALDGFGNRLRAVRQDRGYTQKQFANLLGVTEQAISKYERGNGYPDISILDGISSVLDCSLDYLFQYESGKGSWQKEERMEQRKEMNRYLLPDIISLQFGEAFVPLFLEESKKGFPRMKKLRQQMAERWGVIVPAIRFLDQLTLAGNEYHICIHGAVVYKGRQEQADEEGFLLLLEKMKEMILQKIALVLNNQSVHDMVENLREKYPYIVDGIIPEVISYSKLRQVLILLLQEGYTINPLILIIEAMEQYADITDVKELAKTAAEELGEDFRLENWIKTGG